MWQTDRALDVNISPRPVRLAYLVPPDLPVEMLDAIITECFGRWGGRRTPIIPTDGVTIESAYWSLLDQWDADLIYSYCELSESLESRLNALFAPSEIIVHDFSRGGNVCSPNYLRNFQFLSSLSLLPLFESRSRNSGGSLPEIVDNEILRTSQCGLSDTFGFPSTSCVGVSLLPFAHRIGIRDVRYANQFSKSEVRYIQDQREWLNAVSNSATYLSLNRLSDTLVPYLENYSNHQNGWNNHMTIVVGSASVDRLLMWNAQHRYKSLGIDDDIPIIRVVPEIFDKGVPEWLLRWLRERNYRHEDSSYAKKTILRSCSISQDNLERIAALVEGNVTHVSARHHDNPNIFKTDSVDQNGPSRLVYPARKVTNFRFRNNEINVPAFPPFHMETFSNSRLTRGVWGLELDIARSEDHSWAANVKHRWLFPRRLRLDRTVKIENYATVLNQKIGLILPPGSRPARDGHLVVWDCMDWTRPVIKLPNDYAAFRGALLLRNSQTPAQIRRAKKNGTASAAALSSELNSVSTNRDLLPVSRVVISDKGRDLLGVLQFFDSFPEAVQFLTNPYWLTIISQLSSEEIQNKKRQVSIISKLIQESMSSGDDSEKIATRALALAGQTYVAQAFKYQDFESLYSVAKAHEDDLKDRGNQLRSDLRSSLTYLRNKGFMIQGFHWRCAACEHNNWVELERLSKIELCEICRQPESAPVDGGLHFRLNSFVEHAFSSSSSQGSVLWCLQQISQLAELDFKQARKCFSFAPALDLYAALATKPLTDLDIIANVNGKIILVEVKRGFSGVNEKLFEQMFMVARKIKPDVLMFAIQSKVPAEFPSWKEIELLAEKLKAIDVGFCLLTLENQSAAMTSTGIAVPFGQRMKWSGW